AGAAAMVAAELRTEIDATMTSSTVMPAGAEIVTRQRGRSASRLVAPTSALLASEAVKGPTVAIAACAASSMASATPVLLPAGGSRTSTRSVVPAAVDQARAVEAANVATNRV